LAKTAGNIFGWFPEFSPLKDQFAFAILPASSPLGDPMREPASIWFLAWRHDPAAHDAVGGAKKTGNWNLTGRPTAAIRAYHINFRLAAVRAGTMRHWVVGRPHARFASQTAADWSQAAD
jgi:hypothetical protein